LAIATAIASSSLMSGGRVDLGIPLRAVVVVVVVSALDMVVGLVLGLVGVLHGVGDVTVLIVLVVVLVLTPVVVVLIHGELAVEEFDIAEVSHSKEYVCA
jgi:hypothetical protein